ncbi:MAG: hypothetical protein MR830_09825 [Succinatimonas sp.]|nr:hypothetical protein [Succinatimonas sp.]
MVFKSKVVTWELKQGVVPLFAKANEQTSQVQVQPSNQVSPVVNNQNNQEVATQVATSTENTVATLPHVEAVNNAEVSHSEAISKDTSLQDQEKQNLQTASPISNSTEPLLQNKPQDKVQDITEEPASQDNLQPDVTTLAKVELKANLQEKSQEESPKVVPQVQPQHIDEHKFVPSAQNAVVDGIEVNTQAVAPTGPKWMSLPYKLRKLRADVFINKKSDVDYLEGLVNFLVSKGLDVKDYDDSVHYLPSDVLLLDKTDLVTQGTVYILQAGKKAIWQDLKQEFGDRLK